MKILFGGEGPAEDLPWKGLASYFPGHEIVTCPYNTLLEHLDGIDIVIPFGSAVDRQIIERGSFGLIHQFGVGLERIDIEAATEAGVWVASLPAGITGNADSVAELTVMFMLMLARHAPHLTNIIPAGKWNRLGSTTLWGKTVCIMGLGDLGTAVARRLAAFGMKLIGVRQHPEQGSPPGIAFEHVYGPQALYEALHEADYIVLCVRYDARNHHLIDKAALAAMKQGAFFVNVARGGLVDYVALQQALASGHLAGAGLDVFWKEPAEPDHPIFQQNVLATPHIGGTTDLFYHNGARLLAENITRYAQGQLLEYAANHPARLRSASR